MEQIFFLITTGAKHHLQKKKLDRKTEFVSTDTIAFRCILSLLCFSKYDRSFFCTVYFDRKIWLFSSIRCFSWISNLPLKICIPCTSPTQNWTTCWLFINLLHENTFCLFSYQIPMNKFIIELKIGQPKRTFLWYWYTGYFAMWNVQNGPTKLSQGNFRTIPSIEWSISFRIFHISK